MPIEELLNVIQICAMGQKRLMSSNDDKKRRTIEQIKKYERYSL